MIISSNHQKLVSIYQMGLTTASWWLNEIFSKMEASLMVSKRLFQFNLFNFSRWSFLWIWFDLSWIIVMLNVDVFICYSIWCKHMHMSDGVNKATAYLLTNLNKKSKNGSVFLIAVGKQPVQPVCPWIPNVSCLLMWCWDHGREVKYVPK